MKDQHTKKICKLNDHCRQNYMIPQFGQIVPCRYMITRGIQELSPEDQILIGAKIRNFDQFTEDNDPYGEHDFGSITHAGEKIFWKFDYYDPDLHKGSIDPSNPDETIRVLTIMLASEY